MLINWKIQQRYVSSPVMTSNDCNWPGMTSDFACAWNSCQATTTSGCYQDATIESWTADRYFRVPRSVECWRSLAPLVQIRIVTVDWWGPGSVATRWNGWTLRRNSRRSTLSTPPGRSAASSGTGPGKGTSELLLRHQSSCNWRQQNLCSSVQYRQKCLSFSDRRFELLLRGSRYLLAIQWRYAHKN